MSEDRTVIEVGEQVKSDIVERPAIVDKTTGQLLIATQEMERLPTDQLKLLARLSNGKLVWKKFRVTYNEVVKTGTDQHAFCDYHGCFALAREESDFCSDVHEAMA